MIKDYNEYISDMDNGLYQGSWHATKPEILNKYGITSVIHIGFELAACLYSLTYKYLEIDDNVQCSDKLFNEVIPPLLEYMQDELDNGKKLLVCCSAGRSRSVAIVMAYLIRVRGMSFDDAWELMSSRRLVANPNPGFIKALKMLELYRFADK